MAEGVLGGLLGGEDEASAPEAGEARAGAAAFAASLAADQARHDPAVARAAEAFLRKQGRLAEAEAEELAEQRALRLSHLKLRRDGQRIRIGMQVFVALALTVIGLGLAVMLYDAFTSRSVVVEAFKAPPALAPRGLNGEVVASGVLDQLQKLQDATRDTTKGLGAKSAWGSDVRIEVPETGVSIGEIGRLLHARFGHDLHIGGDLVQTDAGGLSLTVRGDGVPAKTFQGSAGDLDRLTAQAAEYVYGRSQPVRYATYLENANRWTDALAFVPGAFARARDDGERVVLADKWGNAYAGLNESAQAARKYRLVMSLAPPGSRMWWIGWSNLVYDAEFYQSEEAAWRQSEAFLKAAAAARHGKRPELRIYSNPAQITWDLPLLLASSLADATRNGGAGAINVIEGPAIADTYALLHDPAQAERYITSSDPDDPTTKAEALLLQGYAELNRGNAAAAIPPLEAFYKAWLADLNLQYTYAENPCFLGLAYALADRVTEAEAVFKHVGAWSRCYALHGDALAHAGDGSAAQRVWAEGLRIAPDPPMIYLHRGLWELARGDLAAAQADLSIAHTKAPHFADPLKAWGDLLARQGRWKDALAKYDEALKYAPAWTELQQARDAARSRLASAA